MANASKRSKREDGLYSTSVVIGRKADGKLKRKYFYARTIKELDAKRAEFEHKFRFGLLTERENATFYEIGEEYLGYKSAFVSERTLVRNKCAFSKHLQALHPYRLQDLKATHLQMILNGLAKKGFARNTIAEVKQTATQILEYAMMNDYLYRNVFHPVRIPKAGKAVRQPLSKEQFDLVRATWQDHRMGIPALLMLYCGLRRGELIALTWRDVDLKQKTIRITKSATTMSNQHTVKSPKTEAGRRIIPIPDFLADILQHSQTKGSMMVCPSADGSMMSAQSWERAWESYQHFLNIVAGGRDASRSRPKVIAIEPFTAHQLRHTYATLLYNAGVDAKSAQEMLGHANIMTTLEIYTHLSKEKKTNAISTFNQYISQCAMEEKTAEGSETEQN